MRKTGLLASLRRQGFDQSKVTPFTRGAHVACSQCEALVINGVACHETGCPNKPIECKECGDYGHYDCANDFDESWSEETSDLRPAASPQPEESNG